MTPAVRRAQITRGRTDVAARSQPWRTAVDAERDELALLVALEMGKPASVAFDVALRSSITLLQWYGEMADKLIDESPRDRRDALALVTREPVGVWAPSRRGTGR